jgi:stearoyl-CoA desaturase (delta-9 desaturase)
MHKDFFRNFGLYISLAALWIASFWALPMLTGQSGLFGTWFASHTVLKFAAIFVLMAHLTITAMSISFHRGHTHQAIKLHPALDLAMQTFLWAVTSMSKLDWVSVHVYHHTHSDHENDPHSPKQKGLWRVFFMGAIDYSRAKTWPEVMKIRSRISSNAYERFISRNLFTGPIILTALLIVIFGPVYGSLLGLLNFSISPLFAVGGVNAIAHSFGYKNYDAKDESRNIGFIFFLNWIICGELDHNNHHKYPKSPSFAHRWFEFDIGWVYIRILKTLGFARVIGKIPAHRVAKANLESYQSKVALVS